LDVQKLPGTRLHTRVIVRDRKQAFLGSQSLRAAELDSRRELGLVIHDAKTVKRLIETFEADWTSKKSEKETAKSKDPDPATDQPAVSEKEAEKAVQALTKELAPLAVSVKKAVMTAVAKSGEDILHDKDVKHTMKLVVKKAAKEAVKEAVQDAQEAEDIQEAKDDKAAKIKP
jgi:phosphatidylserine/phosphatidylglycerophosphate/cardiolipin synthase-like enzyme